MKAARALVAFLVLAGCSQPAQNPVGDAASREAGAFDSFKSKYKPVITGIDVKGTTLSVFVDQERMSEMDGPVEQAMEDQALTRWRNLWKSNNPGKHATLHVRFRNYFGEDVYTESAKI